MKSTLEGFFDPVVVVDQQGRILACNQAWRGQLPMENLLALLLAAPLRLPFYHQLREVLAGTRVQFRLEFSWNDTIRFCGKVRRLSDPKFAGRALVSLEDITARFTLERNAGYLQTLSEQLHDPIFVMNGSTGEIIYCNPATLRHFELGPDEGPQSFNYGPLFDSKTLPKLVERLTSRTPLMLESVNRTTRGRRIPVEYSLLLLPPTGSGPLISGVIRDISQRKQDLALSLSAGSRLKAILESAPVAILTLTLEGFVASWNHGAEQIYGWSAEEVMLKPAPFAAETSMLEHLGLVVQQRLTRTYQAERRTKDGSSVKLNLTMCPLLNATGQVTGLLEVAEDITDRIRTEQLETSRRLLEAREAERLRLARELHDGALQDLLAIGFSLAELGQRIKKKPSTREIAESVRLQQDTVLAIARQLRSVVSELRPAGLVEFGLVPSLEGLVTKMIPDGQSGPRVMLSLQEIPELVEAQQVCLYRCVQEAVQNSLKHAQAQSMIVTLERCGSNAELVVRDDGCGFQMPTTMEGLTNSNHFGLAGMTERAELLRSSLSVVSSPGRGTEIRVLMPLAG